MGDGFREPLNPSQVLTDELHPVGWAKRSVRTMLATHTRDKVI
jgi:hypothetical protein